MFIFYSPEQPGRGWRPAAWKVARVGYVLGRNSYEPSKEFMLFNVEGSTLKERRANTLSKAQEWASEQFGIKEDKEGDQGTVIRVENGRVYVDGDAGTSEWSYWPHQLLILEDFDGIAHAHDFRDKYDGLEDRMDVEAEIENETNLRQGLYEDPGGSCLSLGRGKI